MDKFSLYVPNFLPCKEFFEPSKNNACPGCGLALAVRQSYKAIEKRIVNAGWVKPVAGGIFGSKTDVSLLRIKKGAQEMMICLDNEAGGGLDEAIKKLMPGIAVAEGFKYVATACPSFPFDLYDKIKRALETDGKSYVHILCPCPVGWQFDPENTVKVGFAAVETRAFPLYEVGGGLYSLTVKTPKPRPLADYVCAQERFSKAADKDIADASAVVEAQYGKLLENIEHGLSYTYETTGKVF